MTLVQFIVPGVAVGKGRPKVSSFGGHVRLYTPKKTEAYEGTVAWYARMAMGERKPLECACSVLISVTAPVAVSWSKKDRAAALAGDKFPTGKPDLDNTVKALFDAMNEIVWKDDAQVCALSVHKRYGAEPGVLVQVMPLAPVPELFASPSTSTQPEGVLL